MLRWAFESYHPRWWEVSSSYKIEAFSFYLAWYDKTNRVNGRTGFKNWYWLQNFNRSTFFTLPKIRNRSHWSHAIEKINTKHATMWRPNLKAKQQTINAESSVNSQRARNLNWRTRAQRPPSRHTGDMALQWVALFGLLMCLSMSTKYWIADAAKAVLLIYFHS